MTFIQSFFPIHVLAPIEAIKYTQLNQAHDTGELKAYLSKECLTECLFFFLNSFSLIEVRRRHPHLIVFCNSYIFNVRGNFSSEISSYIFLTDI